eukprot:1156274-Pelagomonas_calceolata.AAC.2
MRDTLAQKAVSLSPEDSREASVGQVGFRKHAAPGHQHYVVFLISMAHLVKEGVCAYCTEWAWSFRANYASQVQLRALRKGPLTSKLARASPRRFTDPA